MLHKLEVDEDDIGFDEIVKAANMFRSDRMTDKNQDYSKGTTDLQNAILSEFGSVIYEIDQIRE